MGKDREQATGRRVQGKKKTFIKFSLVILILFCATSSDATRVRRTTVQQALGTIWKAEAMYANDHPQGKYTDNLHDLAKYINVTSTLKDIGTEKLIIELSQDETFFSVTAHGRDKCNSMFMAKPGEVKLISKSFKCLFYEKLLFFMMYLFPIPIVIICYIFHKKSKIVWRDWLILALAVYIIAMVFLAFLNFMLARSRY